MKKKRKLSTEKVYVKAALYGSYRTYIGQSEYTVLDVYYNIL